MLLHLATDVVLVTYPARAGTGAVAATNARTVSSWRPLRGAAICRVAIVGAKR